MNQWAFVLAAFAVTLGSTAGLVALSHLGMRRAEGASDDLRERR